MRKERDVIMQKILRWFVLGFIVVVALAPILPQFVWSFSHRWLFPALLPTEWSTEPWEYVASPSSRVGEGFANSLSIAVVVSIMSIVVALPAARALALYNFRGKAVIEWLLMVPIIVPGIVATMGIHQVFIRLDLTDTFIGVCLVHLIPCIPYMVLVMSSVFANYGTELEDTARTLGANPFNVFRFVTLPGILPGLLVSTMFTFLISWGQYITTVLIGGGTIITLPMVLFPFISGTNYSNAAAISLVFVAPAILVLIVTSRQLGRESAVMGGFGRL
jgi:putative spermidine/putrescine transport system permease protein